MSDRLLLLAAGIAVLLSTNMLAQDSPATWEVGVDYSFSHFIPADPRSSSRNLSGVGGSLVYYTPVKWLGFKVDLQGYGSTTSTLSIPVGNSLVPLGGPVTLRGNLVTYLFGPVFKRRGKFEPFAEVLLGGAYTTLYANLYSTTGVLGSPPNGNTFALTAGVGLDIHISRAISIRPIEVGYLLTQFSNPFSSGAINQNSFRYAAGITFNFGGE